MAKQNEVQKTEPAHSFLYEPAALPPVTNPPDTASLLAIAELSLEEPFNGRQALAFARSFTQRISLLWGPPGTGKTTVLAGIVLGWLEMTCKTGIPMCIAIGSSNWNAIDNVLSCVADLLEQRSIRVEEFFPPVRLIRVRGDHSPPPTDDRITDVQRHSKIASEIAEQLASPEACLIVGSTWMQLGKLAEESSSDRKPIAQWFDLLLIDEASQVPVSTAAAYFLLAKDTVNVVLAGDHRQLGPIYGFQMQNSSQGLFDCVFSYMRENHNLEPTALDRNYRTNMGISGWPKERFYPEGYEAFRPERRLEITLSNFSAAPPASWPANLPWSSELLRILDPDLPIAVITYDVQTYTLSNPFEAQIVADLAFLYELALKQNGDCPSNEEFWEQYLGIVTPHRAQMSNIRNLLIETSAIPADPLPAVDTVDRFQGQERNLIISSYAVADRDFVRQEEEFILNPRRFNVTLTRARSKFVMLISESIVQYLPDDARVAEDAAHLQLFVENYCSSIDQKIDLPFFDNGVLTCMKCRLRGRR